MGNPAEDISPCREMGKYRTCLIELESKLQDRLGISRVGLLNHGGDLADAASAASEAYSTLTREGDLTRRLGLVQHALRKIDGLYGDGVKYGLCEECDEPIPTERLEVFPDALYCVRCQEKAEKKGIGPEDDEVLMMVEMVERAIEGEKREDPEQGKALGKGERIA